MITPFIGLSVLVHVGIIFGYWLFSWVPKKELVFRKATTSTHIISFGIIIVIFSMILIPSVFFVKAIIVDKHSSIKFVQNTLIQNNSPKYAISSSKVITKQNTIPIVQNKNQVFVSLIKSVSN